MSYKILFAVATLFFFSCTTQEIGKSKDVNPETVYATYITRYSESTSDVYNEATFRFAGSNGTTLVLTDSSYVQFDEKKLPVDSAQFSGAFYAQYDPVAAFEGKHTWKYRSNDGKLYENSFEFIPVKWKPLPAEFPVADLALEFTGINDGDSVDVSLEDTAVNYFARSYVIKQQKILITPATLARFKPGDLKIDVSYKKNVPLMHTTREGGILQIEYHFKQRVLKLLQKPIACVEGKSSVTNPRPAIFHC